MEYKKKHPKQDLAKALNLSSDQEKRIRNAIQKAYDSITANDFSIDELNAFVAPYIKTQEEAFFAASVIVTEVLGAHTNYLAKNN